jgi:hypothetical protein
VHGHRAVLVDQPDDVRTDLTGEDHADDVDGLRGGHPQAAAELARDAEPGEHLGDLRAAAVDDDGQDAAGPQEDHVLGEGAAALVVHHRVAAVLDHHDVAVELAQPGQRAREDGDLLGVALRVVGAHDARRPDPAGRGLAEGDVGRRGVLVRHHVEYAEFSCT